MIHEGSRIYTKVSFLRVNLCSSWIIISLDSPQLPGSTAGSASWASSCVSDAGSSAFDGFFVGDRVRFDVERLNLG